MIELRILGVEDDAVARRLLVTLLETDGYVVLGVEDGPSALAAAPEFKPDLALLDGELPGANGVEVARRLRQSSDLPIIFVTAANTAEDIRDGFKMGADDYIVKPFDPEELSWRVRAVLHRSGHAVVQVLECGDLVVDEGARSVTRAGECVTLTATEFTLLSVLIRNRTRMVPKGQLLAQVWGEGANDHVLEVHMSSLRSKLEAHGPRMLHTIRGSGYILRP
jgi:two-component system OmpR family response regulator